MPLYKGRPKNLEISDLKSVLKLRFVQHRAPHT